MNQVLNFIGVLFLIVSLVCFGISVYQVWNGTIASNVISQVVIIVCGVVVGVVLVLLSGNRGPSKS